VIRVKELDKEKSWWRELAIIKLETDCGCMGLMKEKYRFEELENRDTETYTIQIAGTSKKINDFIEEIGSENIIEIARTGVTTMAK
jgi:acetolactate synthase-1/3 small subunit